MHASRSLPRRSRSVAERPTCPSASPLVALALVLTAAAVAGAQGAPKGGARKGPAAGRWQEIGRTMVGTVVWVDRRSIERKGDTVTGTFRGVFAKPRKMPAGEVTSSRTTLRLDCRTRRVAILENVYYHDERAGRVFQRTVVGKPGWGPLMGGSVPDVAMEWGCAPTAPGASGRR